MQPYRFAPENASSDASITYNTLHSLADLALSRPAAPVAFADDDQIYADDPPGLGPALPVQGQVLSFPPPPPPFYPASPAYHASASPYNYATASPSVSIHYAPAYQPTPSQFSSPFTHPPACLTPSKPAPPTKRELSISPQKPEKKRSRGGGRGGSAGARGGTAGSRATSRKAKTEEDEKASILEEDEVLQNARWTDAERDELFRFYLSVESEEMFTRLKNNAGNAHKKAAKSLFKGKFSANAIKNQWQQALQKYGYIREFSSFTGGGGDGDLADEDEDEDERVERLQGKISAARSAGKAVGQLNPRIYLLWEKMGWIELFDDRLGKSPKVQREVDRSSAAPLSDNEDTAAESDAESTTGDSKTPAKVKRSARQVSEPRHVARVKSEEGLGSNMSYLREFIGVRKQTEEQKLLRAKQQMANEEASQKRETAKMVLELGQGNVREDAFNMANDILMELMGGSRSK